MSSKLQSVLEECLITLLKVSCGRDNLEIARCVTAPGRDGLDMIYVEVYPQEVAKCGDLCVNRGDRWVIGMLKKLSATAATNRGRERIKVFCGCEPAKARIHFENIEDFLHWVFAHGGYITHINEELQT